MKSLSKLMTAGGILLALGAWNVADAATYTFDFSTLSPTSTTGGSNYGNTKTYTQTNSVEGNLTVKVSAGYLYNNNTQNSSNAMLGQYMGYGLGVTNSSTDEHYVDNCTSASCGRTDYVLFDFSKDVTIEKIVLTVFADGDFSYNSGAWNSTATNVEYKGNSTFTLTSTSVDDIWRVFASLSNSDKSADKFKIKSVTVSTVPLPAAAWLFGSALLGMIGIGRRRRHAML